MRAIRVGIPVGKACTLVVRHGRAMEPPDGIQEVLQSLAAQVPDLGGVLGQVRLSPAPGGAAGGVSLVDNGLGSLLDSSGTPQAVRILVGTLTRN